MSSKNLGGLVEVKGQQDFEKQWNALLGRIARESSSPFGGNAAYERPDVRRDSARQSIALFGRTYLPHYMNKRSAGFHEKWEKIAHTTKEPVLIEAFREAGKSTFFTFLDVLHAILFERAHYILIGAYTVERAAMFSSRILAELLANQRLAADFAPARGATQALGASATVGDSSAASTASAAMGLFKAKSTTVQAISIGQNPRGLVAGPYRPDFVRLDDIQSRKAAQNRKIVEENARWLFMDLLPALAENYNLKIVATQVAERDLVQLLREGNAEQAPVRACRTPLLDKNGVSIWPQQYSAKRVARMQKSMGRRAFAQEYLLQAVSNEDGKLQAAWLRYYDPLEARGKKYEMVVSASDLGGYKTTNKHDFKATVVIGINEEGIDVLAVRIKRETPSQFLRGLYELYQRWEPRAMFWEDNGQQSIMQELFLQEAEKRGQYLPLKPITNSQNKQSRIEGTLFPLIENCRVFFHPQNAMQRRLVEQLLDFPDGAHDDGPDALEMAVRMGLRLLKRGGRGALPRTIARRQAPSILKGY